MFGYLIICLWHIANFLYSSELLHSNDDMEWVILDPASLHEVCGLMGYATSSGEYHIKRESCEGKNYMILLYFQQSLRIIHEHGEFYVSLEIKYYALPYL